MFVAELDGELVGFASVSERQHWVGDVDGYVGELAVAPSASRKGVGRMLIGAAEDWARERGLAHLTLETGASNRTARAFYAALGFLEEDVRLAKRLLP